jgi:DNA-binding LytR/AlgR family response regulator
MKSLEETLPRDRFRRVHRSYIVSLSKVAAVDGNTIEIQEKDKLKLVPVGKNYRDQLQDLIDQRRL